MRGAGTGGGGGCRAQDVRSGAWELKVYPSKHAAINHQQMVLTKMGRFGDHKALCIPHHQRHPPPPGTPISMRSHGECRHTHAGTHAHTHAGCARTHTPPVEPRSLSMIGIAVLARTQPPWTKCSAQTPPYPPPPVVHTPTPLTMVRVQGSVSRLRVMTGIPSSGPKTIMWGLGFSAAQLRMALVWIIAMWGSVMGLGVAKIVKVVSSYCTWAHDVSSQGEGTEGVVQPRAGGWAVESEGYNSLRRL